MVFVSDCWTCPMVFPLSLPCTLCLIAALPCVTTVSGKGCFMVLYVAWRPMFNALHSLPRLFCTLPKGHEYAFLQYFGEKKKRKTNKHHCDFMWDDFRRARPSPRSLHHQIKMNLIFHPSGLLYGDAHLSHRWGFCQSNVWQPVGWDSQKRSGWF